MNKNLLVNVLATKTEAPEAKKLTMPITYVPYLGVKADPFLLMVSSIVLLYNIMALFPTISCQNITKRAIQVPVLYVSLQKAPLIVQAAVFFSHVLAI